MATKKTSKKEVAATKKKEAPKASKSTADKKAPKMDKKTAVKAAPKAAVKKATDKTSKVEVKKSAKAVVSKKINKVTDNKTTAKAKAVKSEKTKAIVKSASKPDKKAPVKAASKVQEKKTAPVKIKKAEADKKQDKKVNNKPVKATVSKDVEKTGNKKDVKKAPNQSLETILPQDKVEVKPKVLAKPPIKRVIAPNPAAVNVKKQEIEKTHYSQAELEEFRVIINKKLDEARRDFDLLKESLSNKDNGTEDTSPTFKLLEDGSDVLSKEELAQLAARQQKFITNLENALIRIQNKTYGVCRITGKLISADRLRIVPHATTSIEGKLTQ